MPTLFDPIELGAIALKNRIVMAPMTRNRAHPEGVPHEMAVTYYDQRASAGLIITEAAQIEAGAGGLNTPGIHNAAQAEAWSKVTKAVHAKGGKIVLQLWHVGRVTTATMTRDGQPPRAPSAIQADAETVTDLGRVMCDTPKAYTDAEIRAVIEQHGIAAEFAKSAGFDGVELHAANGYLIEQFLQDRTNQRTDAWGGTTETRVRFMTEILNRVLKVWSPDRVGVRLSPLGKFNDMGDSDPLNTYGAAIKALNHYGLAYLHVVETFPGTKNSAEEQSILDTLRGHWNGAYMVNGGFDKDSGTAVLAAGNADVIAFGRPFISTPDLVAHYRENVPINPLDEATIYGGDYRGYTDYPPLYDTTVTS